MEGFFIILVFILIAFGFVISKGTGAPSPAGSKNAAHDIPSTLRAKWNAEDASARQRRVTSDKEKDAPERKPAISRDEREQEEETRRQSRRDDHRTKAQRKAMAKLGRGEPSDQNPNRRHDWGQRGHLSGGWLTPAIISLLSAGAVAALFASS